MKYLNFLTLFLVGCATPLPDEYFRQPAVVCGRTEYAKSCATFFYCDWGTLICRTPHPLAKRAYRGLTNGQDVVLLFTEDSEILKIEEQ